MAGQEDNKPNNDETSPNNEIEQEAVDDGPVTEEYDMLDTQLDDLNQALDILEQKNDDIHQKLKELLQSNRDIRQELRIENAKQDSSDNNN